MIRPEIAPLRKLINSAPPHKAQTIDLTKNRKILLRKRPEIKIKLNRRKLIRSNKEKSSKNHLRLQQCSTEPNSEQRVLISDVALSSCDEKIKSHMEGILKQHKLAKAVMVSAYNRKEKELTEKLRTSDVERKELLAKVATLEKELAQVKEQQNTCIVCKKECFRFCGMQCYK